MGQFDYVMANPPSNVNKVDRAKLSGEPRLPFGLPKGDNANYIWIQAFYSALKLLASACGTGIVGIACKLAKMIAVAILVTRGVILGVDPTKQDDVR